MEYKEYVKLGLIKEFEKMCKKNSLDFYSSGCVLTAHLVMEDLMKHKVKGELKEKKVSVEEAWFDAMDQNGYHSGMSAAITATIIARFSPRGEEFKRWCKKNDVVMVNWDNEKSE